MANEDKKLHGSTCALCGNKVKLLDRNYLHMLSDGPLCQKCHMTILQLLTQRRWWISEAEYMQVMQKNYSIRQHHSMPLEKAQALFALRDGVCSNFLKTVDLDDGNVFAVQNVFAMPKSPPIFILRAMKLKKKAVLQGFTLKGTIQKETVYGSMFPVLFVNLPPLMSSRQEQTGLKKHILFTAGSQCT